MVLVLQICCSLAVRASDEKARVSDVALTLNNEGVTALNANDYAASIKKFEQAVRISPDYELARHNLALAHYTYGSKMSGTASAAIGEFHKSVFVDPDLSPAWASLNDAIVSLGKDPNKFDDRKGLGRKCQLAGDTIGALVEYGEACKIKDDIDLRMQMGDLFRARHEEDKAKKQYWIAEKLRAESHVDTKPK